MKITALCSLGIVLHATEILPNTAIQFSLKSIHISKSYNKNKHDKGSGFYGTRCRSGFRN